MPLSEQEQRLLEEMERSLYHNDADFVAGSAGRHGRPTYSRIATGLLIGVVGVATMIAGVGVRLPVVGVLGFIVMFAGVLIALTPPRGASARTSSHSGAGFSGAGFSSADSSGADSSGLDSSGAGGHGPDSHGGSFRQNGSDQWENHPDDQDE